MGPINPELVIQGGTIGLIAFLLVCVWAFMTDRVVSGPRYRQMEDRALRAEERSAEQIELAKQQTATTGELTKAVQQLQADLRRLMRERKTGGP
jgi:hypothetical protein